jgi:GntR family transcriptional regulator, transcriptional repressor for pyruvate dehydrogenase complex
MTTRHQHREYIGPAAEVMADEVVVRHVRELIVRGKLGPGHRLPTERELVRDIGVSRTSVRAGLQALAAKGLLVIRQGAGTFVADGPPVLDSEPLSLLAALHGFTRGQMFEARRTLEVSIARMAAERGRAGQLAAISDAVTGMFAACDDPQAFLVQDIRFHAAVGTASGNPILASVVEMISAMFYEQRRQTADRRRDLRPVAEAHWHIYQAIRDHEPGRAASLMSEHLIQAERDQQAEEPDRQPQ